MWNKNSMNFHEFPIHMHVISQMTCIWINKINRDSYYVRYQHNQCRKAYQSIAHCIKYIITNTGAVTLPIFTWKLLPTLYTYSNTFVSQFQLTLFADS